MSFPENPPFYVINLPKDKDRLCHTTQQLNDIGVNWGVAKAANCHDSRFPFYEYKKYTTGRWWEKDKFKPGAFGCFLSHAQCWQSILSNEAEYGVILEDDVHIEADRLVKFLGLPKGDDFDIIFINFGVCRFLDLLAYEEEIRKLPFISLNKVLTDLLKLGKFSNDLTPGSYGYVVSRFGAKKLLYNMRRDGICMGVDYAMLFGSLNDRDLNFIDHMVDLPSYLRCYLDNEHKNSMTKENARTSLNTYVCTMPPVVYHDNSFGSSLNHASFVGFDVFDERFVSRVKRVFSAVLSK